MNTQKLKGEVGETSNISVINLLLRHLRGDYCPIEVKSVRLQDKRHGQTTG